MGVGAAVAVGGGGYGTVGGWVTSVAGGVGTAVGVGGGDC